MGPGYGLRRWHTTLPRRAPGDAGVHCVALMVKQVEKLPACDRSQIVEAGAKASALRRVTFFAGPKKVTKERPFLDTANPGFRCCGDFPTRRPGSVGKQRTSMCAAPWVWRHLRDVGLVEDQPQELGPAANRPATDGWCFSPTAGSTGRCRPARSCARPACCWPRRRGRLRCSRSSARPSRLRASWPSSCGRGPGARGRRGWRS